MTPEQFVEAQTKISRARELRDEINQIHHDLEQLGVTIHQEHRTYGVCWLYVLNIEPEYPKPTAQELQVDWGKVFEDDPRGNPTEGTKT